MKRDMAGLKVPDFLNTEVKWIGKVIEIDSKDKFDAFMRKLLYDTNLNILDFHKLLKKFATDVVEYHNDSEIISVMPDVDKTMQFIKNYWGEENL